MTTKRLITIAIYAQFVCVAIVLVYLDAVFRWIANSTWLWKNKFPWVADVLGYSMFAATVIGSTLFFVSMARGTPRQRLFCFFPGVLLLSFFVFICADIYERWWQ